MKRDAVQQKLNIPADEAFLLSGENLSRVGLYIQNQSSNNLLVSFGSVNNVKSGWELGNGDTLNIQDNCPTNQIWCICDYVGGSTDIIVIEVNLNDDKGGC